jgi:hypothetical protein
VDAHALFDGPKPGPPSKSEPRGWVASQFKTQVTSRGRQAAPQNCVSRHATLPAHVAATVQSFASKQDWQGPAAPGMTPKKPPHGRPQSEVHDLDWHAMSARVVVSGACVTHAWRQPSSLPAHEAMHSSTGAHAGSPRQAAASPQHDASMHVPHAPVAQGKPPQVPASPSPFPGPSDAPPASPASEPPPASVPAPEGPSPMPTS